MQANSGASLKSWIKTLPSSRMVYPERILDRLKYALWRLYTPFHPFVRDTGLTLRIVTHEGRQDFILGHVAPHLTLEKFISNLVERGYGNHFVAWKDEGELVSLRYVEDFKYQYHLRIFEDGEVRGHYEYTPECHLVWHMQEVGMEDRRHIFLSHLGENIVRYEEKPVVV